MKHKIILITTLHPIKAHHSHLNEAETMSKVPDQNDKHRHWLERVHFEIVTIVTFFFFLLSKGQMKFMIAFMLEFFEKKKE